MSKHENEHLINKLIVFIAFASFSFSIHGQTTYTFVGPGVWHDGSKWFCDFPASATIARHPG